MESVTQTAFRREAKRWLAAVEAGETVEITRYGSPVAILSPPPQAPAGYWQGVKAMRIPRLSLSRMVVGLRGDRSRPERAAE